MTTIYSALNEELIGKVNIEEQEINENLLFNSDLLERCRKHSPRIVKSLVGYGKLYKEELQLVDMRQVHPAGREITNNDTKEVLPKGFQVRSDINIDTGNRDAIAHDISQNDWDPYQPQMILFKLPKEYRYVNNDGIEVIWGILDGNHRFDAASQQLQERIIAWLVDMPLNKVRKYGNAEANRQKNSSKPRSNQDIADSIKVDIKDKTTQLYKDYIKAKEYEQEVRESDDPNSIPKQKTVEQVVKEEINDYNVHANTSGAVYRIVVHESDIVVARKDYDAERRELYISEHYPEYIKVTGEQWDYETPQGVRIILIESTAERYLTVAHKICKMQGDKDKRPIGILYSLAKGAKVTKENRDSLRRQFINQIYGAIEEIGLGYESVFVDKTAIIPSFECLPELADELETKRLIRVI